MTAMHLDATPEGSPLPLGACGILGRAGDTTTVRELVTCKLCLADMRLKLSATPPAVTHLDAETIAAVDVQAQECRVALDRVAARMQERDPDELPAYVLTPERWSERNCKCKRCETCRMYKRLNDDAETFGTNQQAPPRAQLPFEERPRWPRVEAALEAYALHREEGFSFESVAAALIRSAELGEFSSGSFLARIPNANLAAEDVAGIETSLRAAHERANQSMRTISVSYEFFVIVLVGRVVGTGEVIKGKYGASFRTEAPVPAGELAARIQVPQTVIATVMRVGLRCLRIEMAARGLVRAWPVDSELEDAIDARRAELMQRRTG